MSFVDASPRWLKSIYVASVQFLKHIFYKLGWLEKLDKRATESQNFHYFRSLFAIYQLDDMIQLDVPWWTYSAIESIEKYIAELGYKPDVFEYGSGASTLWLAKRSARVISVEHDVTWFEKLNKKISSYQHVELILKAPEKEAKDRKYRSAKMPGVSFESYVKAIHNNNQAFDIIIIDGRSREACLEECLTCLKPNGIIIFDNSDRKRYQGVLKSSLLNISRFRGRVPGSPFASETALLRKS